MCEPLTLVKLDLPKKKLSKRVKLLLKPKFIAGFSNIFDSLMLVDRGELNFG